jgi:amino acid transporter
MTHPGSTSLARQGTSGIFVAGQSVATIAPSAVMASGVGIVYETAGGGTWLAYAAAAVVVLLVGFCITRFASRANTSGSLMTYTELGLGKRVGFAGGWALLLAYVTGAAAAACVFAIYVQVLATQAGLWSDSRTAIAVLLVVATVASTAASIAGVRISTRLLLGAEIFALAVIIVILVAAQFHGGVLDRSQFKLSGATPSGVVLGIVVAFTSFVGFESAASLGAEAENAQKTIPRAIIWSAVIAGVAFLVNAYTQVRILGSGIAASPAPLSDVAAKSGLPDMGYVLDVGVALSGLGLCAAAFNAASRMLYTMAKEGTAPRALARTDERHSTPFVALTLVAGIATALGLALISSNSEVLVALEVLLTLSAFAFMVAYGLVAIAAPVWLWRNHDRYVITAICAALAVGSIAYVFYKDVVPAQPAPLNAVPWILLGFMACGVIWQAAAPRVLAVRAEPRAHNAQETILP